MRKLGVLGGIGLVISVGCGEAPVEEDDGPVDQAPQELTTDKVDLLFVIDNSMSMADKQNVLAPSAVRLVRDLANPPCLDGGGARLADAEQPSSPDAACPAGSTRAGVPVADLRVGFISSSLGDLGSGACGSASIVSPDDRGHLLTRDVQGLTVPTYENLGFLAFDPHGAMSPPGEADLAAFERSITELVVGVGERGCGYEMPLEAMTRFLVDPAPYAELSAEGGLLVPSGVDNVVLEQRAAFLRPDSLVSIVLLADENDCSLDVSGQGHLVLGLPFYKSTSVCETDPNDACCTSCALEPPAGCTADPVCGDQGTPSAAKYEQSEDHQNLKCFAQKERYGMDFSYPIARYTNALSLATIDPSASNLEPTDSGVENPLFAGGRPAQFVSLTTIVGVPWQDLASDPSDPNSPNKTTSEMELDGSWTWIVGGGDPFMIESPYPRTGVSPATGESVTASNPINGGDRDRDPNDVDDLQYACIFDLEVTFPNGPDCDCLDETCEQPLCEGTTQVAAKAYPGVRQLELVRSLGDRGIAGSICPSIRSSSNELISTSHVSRDYNRPLFELETRMWKHVAPSE